MPARRAISNWCSRIVLPPMRTRAFGKSPVSEARRVPFPPATMTRWSIEGMFKHGFSGRKFLTGLPRFTGLDYSECAAGRDSSTPLFGHAALRILSILLILSHQPFFGSMEVPAKIRVLSRSRRSRAPRRHSNSSPAATRVRGAYPSNSGSEGHHRPSRGRPRYIRWAFPG